MPEEVGNSPVVPKEVRTARLTQELKDLTSKRYWLGYRGLNDPIGEAKGVQAAQSEVDVDRNRAQALVFKLTGLEKGLDEETLAKYKQTGVVKSISALDIVKSAGFHPNDIVTDTIGYESTSGGMLRRVPEWKTIYRPEDTESIPEPERLWDPLLQWLKFAQQFGKRTNEVLNPVNYLREIIKDQKSLGRDTSRYEAALSELETVMGGGSIPDKRSVPEAVLGDGNIQDKLLIPEFTPLIKTEPLVVKDEKLPRLYPDIVWENKTLAWHKIASSFGYMPKDINDPVDYLQKTIADHKSMGRNTTRYEEALQELTDATGNRKV